MGLFKGMTIGEGQGSGVRDYAHRFEGPVGRDNNRVEPTFMESLSDDFGAMSKTFNKGARKFGDYASSKEGSREIVDGAHIINDLDRRADLTELRAIDAAHAPFSGQRVAGNQEDGTAGFDPLSQLEENKVLKQHESDRAKMRSMRERFLEGSLERLDASNKKERG